MSDQPGAASSVDWLSRQRGAAAAPGPFNPRRVWRNRGDCHCEGKWLFSAHARRRRKSR